MSAPIPDEQRQAILLEGEPLEEVDEFKEIGSMFSTNGKVIEEVKSRVNLARSVFSSLPSCLWWRRKIPVNSKSRVYQAVVRSILLNRCKTWLI